METLGKTSILAWIPGQESVEIGDLKGFSRTWVGKALG